MGVEDQLPQRPYFLHLCQLSTSCLYLSVFFKYRTFLTASQCIASALIGGKGSPQEIGASAIFTSTGSPPKGRTAFGVEMLTDVFGPPSKCRCNFCPYTADSQGILIVPCPRPSCTTICPVLPNFRKRKTLQSSKKDYNAL